MSLQVWMNSGASRRQQDTQLKGPLSKLENVTPDIRLGEEKSGN